MKSPTTERNVCFLLEKEFLLKITLTDKHNIFVEKPPFEQKPETKH